MQAIALGERPKTLQEEVLEGWAEKQWELLGRARDLSWLDDSDDDDGGAAKQRKTAFDSLFADMLDSDPDQGS